MQFLSAGTDEGERRVEKEKSSVGYETSREREREREKEETGGTPTRRVSLMERN